MKSLLSLYLILLFVSCQVKQPKADASILTEPNILHQNTKQLTEVIIHDAFSPPVASRIYAYTSLAAYEAIKHERTGYPSIAAQLNAFNEMPLPEQGKKHNYLLAATKAFFTVAEKITFSADTLNEYQKIIYSDFKSLLDEETYERSISFGQKIGEKILERAAADNYKQTRGMPKFIGTNEEGKWRPTPPDYFDGAEPHWSKLKPLTLTSPEQFTCPVPPPFSSDSNSVFYQVAKEVYTTTTTLSKEQIEIAKYWDDNPFVMEHSGHLMYATKKITPVGHWIGIAGIACKMKDLSAVQTAQTYLLTAIAIYDSFISCWGDKYVMNVIRPVTVINDWFDRNWQPLLQTPPFPEHPSGHSAISAASATVLTNILGENFAFEDTSDLEYIGMKRTFSSFDEAAREASLSRLYGGIHFRSGIDAGAAQGRKVGAHVLSSIKLKM